jgi:DNA-binding NtrC family response regulator/iron only hydrogenase large subunit-like protein
MSIVSTEASLCRRCYACVRNCPVKAVKVDSGRVSVSDSACISCGLCKNVCAQRAKRVRDDVQEVLRCLGRKTVVALLAPSFPAAFTASPERVVGALRLAGFNKVMEVAFGAEMVAAEYSRLYSGKRLEKPLLSSACPAVVNIIEQHFPQLISNLVPLVSPMVAAARAARKLYGERTAIVFFGPCVAKKSEAAHMAVSPETDFALTFSELQELLAAKGVSLEKAPPLLPDVPATGLGGAFPLSGGLLKTAGLRHDILNEAYVVVEGRQQVLETLRAIESGQFSPALVDILFCRGCLDGPDMPDSISFSQRRQKVAEFVRRPQLPGEFPAPVQISLSRKFTVRSQKLSQPTEKQLREILHATAKFRPEDELNCGACGYDSCREKAVAVCRGYAEINMCLPFLLRKSEQEIERYKEEIEQMKTFRGISQLIVGEHRKVRAAKEFVLKAAQSSSTVLLLGESGTGKGLYARAIHSGGARREGPFVKVNCGAIPETLLESELFGYEEGSFTGAQKGGKPGKFELAHQGTIFLDEIGDLPYNMQAKLLRVLQEKEIERVGGRHSIPVDARIIAATNKNLREEVQRGAFREDLFYRLDVLTINVPPLREVASDIPLLVESLLERLCHKLHLPPKTVREEVVSVFCRYPWPGNVRELENILERLLNLVEGDVISIEHLPPHLWQHVQTSRYLAAGHSLEKLTADLEREAIENALSTTGNNRTRAAELLGLHRSTFYEKLNRYNLLKN